MKIRKKEVREMYNKNVVLAGVIAFIILMTAPFWLNAGRKYTVPELEMPLIEKECVEPASWMRANHMQLLDDWRNSVVRAGERDYTSEHFEAGHDNKTFKKSLTLTCLDCHDKKENFCDKCHTYAGVKPYCWSCHVVPDVTPERKI